MDFCRRLQARRGSGSPIAAEVCMNDAGLLDSF
jgi:hypothetical protein